MIFNKKANNPLITMTYLFKGIKLLTRPELRKFIIIPIMINIVLYSIAFVLGYLYAIDLINSFIPAWLHWLSWILLPLFAIGFFIIMLYTFTVFANIISAPFYEKLSIKTLSLITEEILPSIEHPWHTVITAELKRLAYIGLYSLPLLILFFIPVINMLAPFLFALFGAWCMALEYLAYPLENRGMLFADQKNLLKTTRFGVLGFGGIILLGLGIPIINIMIAPAAVIGATLYIHELKE